MFLQVETEVISKVGETHGLVDVGAILRGIRQRKKIHTKTPLTKTKGVPSPLTVYSERYQSKRELSTLTMKKDGRLPFRSIATTYETVLDMPSVLGTTWKPLLG